jgi:hypothetical protein
MEFHSEEEKTMNTNHNLEELYQNAEIAMNEAIDKDLRIISWNNYCIFDEINVLLKPLKESGEFKYVTLANGIESRIKEYKNIHDEFRKMYDSYVDNGEDVPVTWESATEAIKKVRELKYKFEDDAKIILLNAIRSQSE